MEMLLNRVVPERLAEYTHTMEGSDDMPAHAKCSLFGVSLTIPICNGKLGLGTWQGIWLCEHRNRACKYCLEVVVFRLATCFLAGRSVVITLQGESL